MCPRFSANYGKPEDGVRRVSFPQCFVDFWNQTTRDIAKKLPVNVFERTTRLYLNEVKNRIDTRLRRKGLRKPKPTPLPGSAALKKRKKRLPKKTTTPEKGDSATAAAAPPEVQQSGDQSAAVVYVPCEFVAGDNSQRAELVVATSVEDLVTVSVTTAGHQPQWSKDEGQYEMEQQAYYVGDGGGSSALGT